jgi:hypothetical protein
MTSASLFKWTVFLLAIPAALLSALVALIVFLMFVGSPTGANGSGTGGWAVVFAISPLKTTLIAASAFLVIIIVGFAIGRRLLRGN